MLMAHVGKGRRRPAVHGRSCRRDVPHRLTAQQQAHPGRDTRVLVAELHEGVQFDEADLAECRVYSSEVASGEKAVKGAASGAVVGGAVGAVIGGSSDAARGAGVGAITGGARGISQGERDKLRVVKNCLRGRGYRVLN